MGMSRREFVQLVASSGIALTVSPLALAEEPSFEARETLPGRHRWNPAATGAGRIDGVPKVTGAKLYASDFVPPISRVGRRRPRTRCWSSPRTPRTSTPAWISRA